MKIYLPWRNLGCFGIRIGEHRYADIFRSKYNRFGFAIFYHWNGKRGYLR